MWHIIRRCRKIRKKIRLLLWFAGRSLWKKIQVLSCVNGKCRKFTESSDKNWIWHITSGVIAKRTIVLASCNRGPCTSNWALRMYLLKLEGLNDTEREFRKTSTTLIQQIVHHCNKSRKESDVPSPTFESLIGSSFSSPQSWNRENLKVVLIQRELENRHGKSI